MKPAQLARANTTQRLAGRPDVGQRAATPPIARARAGRLRWVRGPGCGQHNGAEELDRADGGQR